MNVNVYFYKEHKDAKLPDVAYGNTSAAFDIYAVEDVEIKPGESKVVENGIRCSIHENDPYYMEASVLSEGSDESSVLLSLQEKAESLPSKPGVVSNGIHPIPSR